ncbi:MAG: ATP-binding protein [Crocinitomicaceae bacterium]
MTKLTLLFTLLFLVGCQSNQKVEKVKTANQIQIEKWYTLGVQQTQRDLDLLRVYADRIEQASTKEPRVFQAMGKLLIGFSYFKESNDNLAYKNFMEAKELLKGSNADSLKISLYNSIGQYFKTNGDNPKAIENSLISLKLAEKANDEYNIGSSHSSLGDLYLYTGDLKLAKKHLDMADNLLKKDKNKPNYLVNSHSLANYNGMKGNIAKAMEIDEEGLALCTKNDFYRLKVTFLDNKANCFFYNNQFDSAEVYFQECLRQDRLNKNIQQESDSYLNLAHVAFARNNEKKGKLYIDSSLILAQRTNYKHGILKANDIQMDLYRDKKEYKALSEAQAAFQETYKALMNDKKEKAFAYYNALYETEKKEIKLLQSKIDLSKKEKLIQSKNSLLQLLLVITVALVGLGYLIYRQLKMRNKQQEQEFELKSAIQEIESRNDLQNQRLQISRDLHDNIGAQLTFIISSVDNLTYAFEIKNPQINQQLSKINDFAKSTIIELRDTIWAMNSTKISNEDLKDRIYNFLEKAQGASNDIKFNVSITEKLTDYSFSSLMGINVYRVLQEAVNNAIKYAQATQIRVTIDETAHQIVIRIQDDGIGFDPNNVDLGNGLLNMRKRMEEIDGQLSIESILTQGTTITLTCPKTE